MDMDQERKNTYKYGELPIEKTDQLYDFLCGLNYYQVGIAFRFLGKKLLDYDGQKSKGQKKTDPMLDL